ncbi:hypothetical protein B5S31_g5057 [[Candida] boidinii]|uniref:Unnamed protein product n=1 Tax=Candida boidinii TaxID=5477 RepID=A0ACB5TL46_CANBO|nr:hypothetical protein B5S29_g5405 [[Candida] boidinii]OWB75192.1 hypothetical protein B5S31_g5057 [[Candida] boidinii]OWB80613.1 hypothetical protein B5S32_g4901 [[Candida] boidinii]GME90374.1 unnamed protein product [[Candida] boidinii]
MFGNRMGMTSGLNSFNSPSPLTGAKTTAPAAGTLQDLANDITVPNGPEDSISDISFSPQAEFLSVASWDKKNRIYEINTSTGQVEGRAMYEHDGPVLSTRWSTDGMKVVSGGVDRQVKLFDLGSQQNQTIGTHNDAVRSVRFVEVGPQNTPVVVSGSWDKTLKYWDMRQQNPVCSINLPERVYCMDSVKKLLVVATAERHISIINLDSPDKIFRQTVSPLKYQTRSICCYPSADGFAVGSIEGRCAIQYVDENQQKELGFSFKCQRETKSPRKDVYIYSLNAISFHPLYGTFSTAGSDGTFNYWDKDAKNRLKGYPSFNSPITATAFNRNGSIFAYALSYDWSKGYEFNKADYPNMVRLHAVKDEEIKQRARAKK